MRIVAKVVLATLLPLLLPRVGSLLSSPPTYWVYMPAVAVAPPAQCLTYKATMWLEAPATVYAGQEFEVTAFLRNDDCSHIGMPMYVLLSNPQIWDPPPQIKGEGVMPGETGSVTFTVIAPTEPQTFELSVGAFFEAFYPPPPGSWSWGGSGTPLHTVTVKGHDGNQRP